MPVPVGCQADAAALVCAGLGVASVLASFADVLGWTAVVPSH